MNLYIKHTHTCTQEEEEEEGDIEQSTKLFVSYGGA